MGDNNKETCFICLVGSHEKQQRGACYLRKLCNCNSSCHVNCFLPWYDTHLSCNICTVAYRVNLVRVQSLSMNDECQCLEWDPKVYFPFDDVYPQPLFSNLPLSRRTGMECLSYAIIYLQTDRIDALLRGMSERELRYIFRNACIGDLINYLHRGTLCSNYMRDCNRIAYKEVLCILNKYKKL